MFTSAQHVATDVLLAVLLLGSSCISSVNGSSFVIDDERVKTIDISPALGRGYSIKTNQFHSICLDVEETTEPSYNYDYTYTDVTTALDKKTSTKLSGKVGASFGWAAVKTRMSTEINASSSTKTHTVMTTMRIERYYSSVMENKASLSADASKLLERKDYVGFYKACGPNYVRSIRRAQEVTAMFTFESSDTNVEIDMKARIKATAFGSRYKTNSSMDSSVNIDSSMQSLQIQIMGFGLGLDKDGSETLVATSLEEYNAAMKFAFSSMTRGNQGSAQTGMVYGIELVPWTDNTAFQVASNLHETAEGALTFNVPYEMIPDRVNQKCLQGDIDKNGKCCKDSDMKKNEDGTKFCQPVRRFPVDLLKQNLQRNGEHVAMMDTILHYKSYTIMNLERCIQVLNSFPESEKHTYLETPDSVVLDEEENANFKSLVTVGDLKQFLDPNGDMASVDLLNMELDEYVDKYYNPCMAALFGMNAKGIGGSDPGDTLDYFMMKQWNSHTECKHASCVIPTNSWDSKDGGCKASFGQIGTAAPVSDVGHCASKVDPNTGDLSCKRDAAEWTKQVGRLNGCWNKNSTPFVLIDRYCTPRLSEMERAENFQFDTITNTCTTTPSTPTPSTPAPNN